MYALGDTPRACVTRFAARDVQTLLVQRAGVLLMNPNHGEGRTIEFASQTKVCK